MDYFNFEPVVTTNYDADKPNTVILEVDRKTAAKIALAISNVRDDSEDGDMFQKVWQELLVGGNVSGLVTRYQMVPYGHPNNHVYSITTRDR